MSCHLCHSIVSHGNEWRVFEESMHKNDFGVPQKLTLTWMSGEVLISDLEVYHVSTEFPEAEEDSPKVRGAG